MKKPFKKFHSVLTGVGVERLEREIEKILQSELPLVRRMKQMSLDPIEVAELEKRRVSLLRQVLKLNQKINYSEHIMPLPMLYFEVHDPYYGLVKAKSKKLAMIAYTTYVADDDGTLESKMQQVERDYALLRWVMSSYAEDKNLLLNGVLTDFNKYETSVLIIDSALA